MQLRRIELRNIRKHECTEIELGSGLTLFLGPNGAGKSSVIQALGWAMFDYWPLTHQELIRQGESVASCTIEFEADGTDCLLSRSTTSGHTMLAGDVKIRGRDSCLTAVAALLHVERSQLTRIFTQGLGAHQFALLDGFGSTPGAREAYWRDLLDLGVYRRVYGKMRSTLNELETQSTILRGKLWP